MNDSKLFTILIVDDAPENIDVLSSILEDEYRLQVAINGELALKISQSSAPPDLILLDIIMPGMDGYEVCRVLKEQEATRHIPVIFVSAMDQEMDETRGFEVGAVDYITKPVSPSIVHARVKTQLALYHQNRVLEQKVQERTIDLMMAKERAEASEKVKTQFLENMSHEIKTPLNGLLGYTNLIELSAKEKMDEDEQIYFERVRAGGARIMRTVSEILDISQIETGAFNFNKQNIKLDDFLAQIISQYLPAAEEKGLKLVYNCEAQAATIFADEYCIEQALGHLVDNAVKYTEVGEIKVTLTVADHGIIVVVADTGLGMSENYIQHLFDIFSQESEGYSKKFQGIGLGLALTRRYLRLNDCTISGKSKLGVGSTFLINFNLAEGD